jgi:hypothetical protein
VTAGGFGSNTQNFTVLPQGPAITYLSETTGAVGDTITINGHGFGTGGSVAFNTVVGSPTIWTDGQIVTTIPAGAQTGSVIVTSNGLPSNSATLMVVSPPNVTGVSPGSGDAGTVVTISGAGFGTLIGGDAVLFNNMAVSPTTWTDQQITATVPKGASTGSLVVRVAHILSNPTAFAIVPTGSQTLSILPSTGTLGIGETIKLKLMDDLLHSISGATWTLSDNTLAQLSTDDPPVLTANNSGTLTITASSQGLTGTSQITIGALGAALPAGTVKWSLPPVSGLSGNLRIMPAAPGDGTTPDLFSLETVTNGVWLRGMSASGEQKWYTQIAGGDGSQGLNAPDQLDLAVPDNGGGVVSVVTNPSPVAYPYAGLSSVVRVNGTSGTPVARYDSPGNLGGQVVIDQNGNMFAIETVNPRCLHWVFTLAQNESGRSCDGNLGLARRL